MAYNAVVVPYSSALTDSSAIKSTKHRVCQLTYSPSGRNEARKLFLPEEEKLALQLCLMSDTKNRKSYTLINKWKESLRRSGHALIRCWFFLQQRYQAGLAKTPDQEIQNAMEDTWRRRGRNVRSYMKAENNRSVHSKKASKVCTALTADWGERSWKMDRQNYSLSIS